MSQIHDSRYITDEFTNIILVLMGSSQMKSLLSGESGAGSATVCCSDTWRGHNYSRNKLCSYAILVTEVSGYDNKMDIWIYIYDANICGCNSVSIKQPIPDRQFTIKNIGETEVNAVTLHINERKYLGSIYILRPGKSGTYLSANFPVGDALLTWEYPKDENNTKRFHLADYINPGFSGELVFQISNHKATVK